LLRDPWEGFIDYCAEALIIRRHDFEHLIFAATPDEAVQVLTASLGEGGAQS
jgi:hypothetical protein